MKKAKVSLIIPVYNGADYIEEAINSALNQTYENLEIIVVNDGSKDNTEQICLKYKDKIKYYAKENGGVATALNLALEKMTGEYFSWLSHDDLYYPNKIEEEMKIATEDSIIFSNYDLINEKSEVYNKIEINKLVIQKHNEYALLNGLINGITLLIPKKAFDECGKFKKELWCTQDYDMWYRMMLKGYKFVFVDKILASSRQHEGQTTNTSSKTYIEGNILWINMIENLPDKFVNRIFLNKYNMYRKMANFLKQTPYKDAYEYIENKKNESRKTLDIHNIKVSVIVPFYDESIEVLNRCVNSIINQTHENLEILLINDNPEYYKENDIKKIIKDSRICYIKNSKNEGVSASRNKAIKKSTGKYISFLDADDEYLPNKIYSQVLELELCNESFIHCSYIRRGNDSEPIYSGNQQGYIIPNCISKCQIATPCVMIKKSIVEKEKFYFDETIHIGEDTCLWLKIALEYELLGLEEPLVNIYVDEHSAYSNTQKQIVGIKNILTFVLNSKELSVYDKNISELALLYFKIVQNSELPKENNSCISLILKTLKSLRKNGIKGTIKKIKKYVSKK